MPFAIREIILPLTFHEVKLEIDNILYILSDDFVEQYGGPKQKKYMAKNFRNLLLSIQDRSMIEQWKFLDTEFKNYRKDAGEVDELLVIGIKYR